MCDQANLIQVEERHSATGDRRWRAFTTNGVDYDGFGETAEAALSNFIGINSPYKVAPS